MKRQEKGWFPGGNHDEVLKANSTPTATKKKGKSSRSGKQQQQQGKYGGNVGGGKSQNGAGVQEKRENDGGEYLPESLKTQEAVAAGVECWDGENWSWYCSFCAVVEQISWGTSWWCPARDAELMSGVEACRHHQNHYAFGPDVQWDDCIWDLNDEFSGRPPCPGDSGESEFEGRILQG